MNCEAIAVPRRMLAIPRLKMPLMKPWRKWNKPRVVGDLSGNLKLKNIAQARGGSGTSTSSATFAVVSGVTVTFTTKGNNVLISASMTVLFNAGGTGNWAIFRDGTQVSGIYTIVGAANAELTVTLEYIDSPTAGSHTFDLRWKSISSTSMTAEGSPSIQATELG